MSRAMVLSAQRSSYVERKQQLENEPLPANLGELLETAATTHHDKPLLHFFESDAAPLTYGEFFAQVNQLANAFSHRGIVKGTHVGVMLPNIRHFPLTWLALARIGAVIVPINIGYTPRELHYVLDDSDAQWLVIHHDFLDTWEQMDTPPAAIRPDANIIVVGPHDNRFLNWDRLIANKPTTFDPPWEVTPDDLMNIQYTSGTTGFPKGCMLSHRYWLISGKQNAFRDGLAYKRILAATPFFYMDPQWQLIMSLYSGACLYVARRQSASRFMQWVHDYKVNFVLLPDVVLKQPVAPFERQHEILRANVYGLSKNNHQQLQERFDLCAREAFGMTEIGTGLFVPIECEDMVGSGSCGVPAPFREARVADPQGNTLPDGEIGELLVKGPGIMSGYYKRLQATAQAFHGDWFRTGDLFRRDENGYFYIVGRIKDMIRRAGENISAHELESVLLAHPGVFEAAVVPVKDDTRGEEVKAYIVPKDDADQHDLLDSLFAHCHDRLAPFKVPRYVEFRAALPKTASDKIAKTQLTAEKTDLRAGSFDRVTGQWHPELQPR